MWSRVYAINTIIGSVLQSLPNEKINIINLGAGHDTLYYTLKQKHKNIVCVEFDYSDITYKKVYDAYNLIQIETIKKSKVLQDVICADDFAGKVKIQHGNIYSEDYYLLECDITDNEKISEKLKETNINFNNFTIVISECLLVYLKKDTTYYLLQNLTEKFRNILFIEYDLIGAKDGFGQEMIENLLQRDIHLRGYEDVPDVFSQEERLLKTGFTNSEVYDMLDYYNNCIDFTEKKRIEALEFVDEFEEWNLMQSHSCIGYGIKCEDSNYSFLNDAVKIKK